MRQAERALFDLRRGLPILLRQPAGDTLVQAVEGLDDDALAALQLSQHTRSLGYVAAHD